MPTIEKTTVWVEKNMPNDTDRKCHQCDEIISKEELVKRLVENEAKIQSFTGRLFCSDVCWNGYLQDEGFMPRDDDEEWDE